MAVPLIRALQSLPHVSIVDVLVGDLPDDFGAWHVLSKVVCGQGKIYVREALERDYDVAVMAIPYDGRWWNGVHFRAKTVMDGRPRPDPTTMGFSSWKKHEVEYQMENARSLGFEGNTPSCQFLPYSAPVPKSFYVGVGYKKDRAGFWKVKHWGNENYAKLIKILLERHPDATVHVTGDLPDFALSIAPIAKLVSNQRLVCSNTNIEESFSIVSSCTTYIGNDTGMMHVAAACDRRVVGLFFMENAATKNHPWCSDWTIFDGSVDREKITPELVAERL